MKCIRCSNNVAVLRTALIEGKFGLYCDDCIAGQTRQASARSAQYTRERDYAKHQVDTLQPWDRKGLPNRDFIRNYPEESQDMFSKEELERYG